MPYSLVLHIYSRNCNGVCAEKSTGNTVRYAARVWANGKSVMLGYFALEADAAQAHDAAVLKLRGPESELNVQSERALLAAAAAPPSRPAQVVVAAGGGKHVEEFHI